MVDSKIEDWLPIIRRRAAALVRACDAVNLAMADGASKDVVAQLTHQGYEALARLDEAIPGGFRDGFCPEVQRELDCVIAEVDALKAPKTKSPGRLRGRGDEKP
jgi:hypothetical protein